MAFQIAKTDIDSEKTTTKVNVTALTRNQKPTSMLSTITNYFLASDDKFQDSINLMNKNLIENSRMLQGVCESVYNSWPRDEKYSFTIDDLRESIITKNPDIMKKEIMRQIEQQEQQLNENNIQNNDDESTLEESARYMSKLAAISTIDASVSLMGIFVGISKGLTDSVTTTSRISSVNSKSTENNDPSTQLETVNENIPVDPVILDTVTEYTDKKLTIPLSVEVQNEIIEKAMKIATQDVTELQELSRNILHLNALKQSVCSNTPVPKIEFNDGLLSFINNPNSDKYFIDNLELLEANIMKLVKNKSGTDKLNSAIEKIQVLRELFVEAYRFHNTKLFEEQESMESILKKMEYVTQAFGQEVGKVADYLFPVREKDAEFEITAIEQIVAKGKKLLEAEEKENELSLAEVKSNTNYFTGLFENSLGLIGFSTVNWTTSLIRTGVIGIAGPLIGLFVLFSLIMTARYNSEFFVLGKKGSKQANNNNNNNNNDDTINNNGAIKKGDLSIQGLIEITKKKAQEAKEAQEANKINWEHAFEGRMRAEKIADRFNQEEKEDAQNLENLQRILPRIDMVNKMIKEKNKGGTNKTYHKKKALRSSVKRNGKKTIKKNRKRNIKKNTRRIRKKQ